MTEPTTTPSGSEYRVVTVADLRHELQREHLIINAHIQTISNQITAIDLRFGDFREVVMQNSGEAKDNIDQRFTDMRHEMNQQFTSIDQRFTSVDQRFAEAKANTDQRFTEMQHHIDQRFTIVDQSFTEAKDNMNQQFTAVDQRFTTVDQRFTEAKANTDQRFTEMQHHIDQRFTTVDQRFTEAKTNTDQRFDQMEKLFVQVGRRFDALDERLRFNKTLVVASISAVASAASVVVSLLR